MLLSKVPLWRPLASPGRSLHPQVPVHSATMSKKSSTLAHTAATLFRAFARNQKAPCQVSHTSAPNGFNVGSFWTELRSKKGLHLDRPFLSTDFQPERVAEGSTSRLSRPLGTRAAWAFPRDQILEEATHFFVLLLKKLKALAELVQLLLFIFKSPLKLCMSGVLLMIALRQAPFLIPQSLLFLVGLLKSGSHLPDLLLLLVVQKYSQRMENALLGAWKVGIIGRKILSHSLFHWVQLHSPLCRATYHTRILHVRRLGIKCLFTDSDILVCVGRFGFSEFLHTCHVSPSQLQSRLIDLSQKYWRIIGRSDWANKAQDHRKVQKHPFPLAAVSAEWDRVMWQGHMESSGKVMRSLADSGVKPKTKIIFFTDFRGTLSCLLCCALLPSTSCKLQMLPLTSYQDIEGTSVSIRENHSTIVYMNTDLFPAEIPFSKGAVFVLYVPHLS